VRPPAPGAHRDQLVVPAREAAASLGGVEQRREARPPLGGRAGGERVGRGSSTGAPASAAAHASSARLDGGVELVGGRGGEVARERPARPARAAHRGRGRRPAEPRASRANSASHAAAAAAASRSAAPAATRRRGRRPARRRTGWGPSGGAPRRPGRRPWRRAARRPSIAGLGGEDHAAPVAQHPGRHGAGGVRSVGRA
jgi:hypothetical protein